MSQMSQPQKSMLLVSPLSQSPLSQSPNVSSLTTQSPSSTPKSFLEKYGNILIGSTVVILVIVAGYFVYKKYYQKKTPVDCKLSDWIWDDYCNCEGSTNGEGKQYARRNIIQKADNGGVACPSSDDDYLDYKVCNCGATVTTRPPGGSGTPPPGGSGTPPPGGSGTPPPGGSGTPPPGGSGTPPPGGSGTPPPGGSGTPPPTMPPGGLSGTYINSNLGSFGSIYKLQFYTDKTFVSTWIKDGVINNTINGTYEYNKDSRTGSLSPIGLTGNPNYFNIDYQNNLNVTTFSYTNSGITNTISVGSYNKQ